MTPDITRRTAPAAPRTRLLLGRLLLTCAVLPCLAVTPATAQEDDVPTVPELVAKNLEARGGAEDLRGVGSARFQGTMTVGGGGQDGEMQPAPFTLEWERPSRVRMEMTLEGMPMVQGYDGQVSWQLTPFLGPEPRRMTEEEARAVERMAGMAVEGLLLDWEERGRKVEALGMAEVDGEPVHRLRVTDEAGHVTDLYLDADTYLERRLEEERKQPGGTVKVVTNLGDYRPVDGVLLPFRVEQQAEGAPAGQRFELEKIELGVDFPQGHFAMPEAESEEGRY